MEKVRRAAICYFFLQGLAVVGWWVFLYLRPDSQVWFVLDPHSAVSLYSFLIGDLLLIAPGSIATAVLVKLRWRHASAFTWLVTGGIAYASFYTFAYVLQTDVGWLGLALMFPSLLWSGVFASALTLGGEMFRKSSPGTTRYILLKTLAQILVVWTLILGVFPYLIRLLEDKLSITHIELSMQQPIAAVLFIAISLLGIWAAVVMSRVGKGTPLPLDHATELVVTGPYRYVRNPMALSGIGQGIAVAMFLGSPLVLIYALMGSAIWQLVFRPIEEDDLEARFGDSFRSYRTAVRCWIPNLSSYSGPADR
ncbi:MAG: isoprenylcysteine carboxylmethyltransferase family protein [Pyrinomonadaceae bacterium]